MAINIRGFFYLILLDIKKAFRDVKYVAFIILLPVLFYILYTHIFSSNAAVGAISWSEYSLVSMISFGIMGNSINLLGTKVADEKQKNWYTFIRTSVVDTKLYGLSHIFSYLVISFIFTIIMFLVAFLINDVNLSILTMMKLIIVLLLGSIPFLFLALIIGELGSIAQPVGTIVYLFLSFLGGLWMPIDAMPETMGKIAKYLPSYLYADNGWKILENNSNLIHNSVGLLIWSIIFLIIFSLIQKTKKNNK